MQNLYTITAKRVQSESSLTPGELTSIFYHDLFDYPLSFADLIRWRAEDALSVDIESLVINSRSGFYFLEGKEGMVYKRLLRERISAKKLEIAKKAARVLSTIPTIKMIAVTGSLAMENAGDESDIDLMIVTKKGTMWTTRLLSLGLLAIFGIPTRRANDKNQKDKICPNIWLDESDLKWNSKKNIYTAHEIAQIKPLVDKESTYEKFLSVNKWILKFWPNSVRIQGKKERVMSQDSSFLSSILIPLERLAYRLQYHYMKSKITREVITSTRALFHPQDWGEIVLSRFSS